MPDWLEWALGAALLLLVVVVVLSPSLGSGKRVLRTWGIRDPNDEQAAEARIYLLQRRVLYVFLFMGLRPASGALDLDDLRLPGLGIFGPLVAAMLIGELISLWWPVGGVRSASLERRGWRDLVPRWAVGTVLVLVALVVVFAVAAPTPLGDRLTGVAYAAGCLVLVGLVVHLAVRRPSGTDEAVATALRLRTARVAVGIGFAWLGTALTLMVRGDITGWSGNAMYVLLAAVLAWIWIANGTQKVFARSRR